MDQARLAARPFLVIERRFPVAPERVWRAWTEAKALKRWFGPGGPQPVSAAELDLRVGGRFRIVFGGPDGNEHEAQGVYREIVPNRKLVFTWTWPRTTPERLFDEKVRDDHRRGWSETFEKLAGVLQQPE